MLQLRYRIESEEAQRMLREAPEALAASLAEGVDAALALFHGAVQQNIRSPHGQKPPAVAYGYLANAITTEQPEPLYGRVFVAPPADVYGTPVETGTAPHFPPVAAIERWVEKKFAAQGMSRSEMRGAAFAIARKIAARGTQGHFMFQRAYEQNREAAETLIDAALDKALERLAGSR
ncbi:MAG TPA: hypothetical protein VNL70_02415 [Tepidisphaeraceae bacterium]|nr:hypothetical protein [Tepidisphaeraceae bacterium]